LAFEWRFRSLEFTITITITICTLLRNEAKAVSILSYARES